MSDEEGKSRQCRPGVRWKDELMREYVEEEGVLGDVGAVLLWPPRDKWIRT